MKKNNIIIELSFFEVVCKCGHVGKKRYIEIHFPIMATSRKEAARKARDIPRVKHDYKDAILNVVKIDQERYNELSEMNNYDPYLHCSCIQDQNLIDISDRLKDEEKTVFYKTRKNESSKDFYCGKLKIHDAKKFMNHYYDFEDYNDISA